MLESRAHNCPICRKVTERPRDGIPIIIERCKHKPGDQKKEFLEDDDEDVFADNQQQDEQESAQDEENEDQQVTKKKKVISKFPLTDEQKKIVEMHENIYKASQTETCKQHIFCSRERMIEEVKPEESSTLPKQERWYTNQFEQRGNKLRLEQVEAFQEVYKSYIYNQDFPQRNLITKKQQFAQGNYNSKEVKEAKEYRLEKALAFPNVIPEPKKKDLPKTEKELKALLEDGVLKYKVVDNVSDEAFIDKENAGIKQWIDNSTQFSSDLTKERLKWEKRESEDQKKREKEAKQKAHEQTMQLMNIKEYNIKESQTQLPTQTTMNHQNTFGAETFLGTLPSLGVNQRTQSVNPIYNRRSKVDHDDIMRLTWRGAKQDEKSRRPKEPKEKLNDQTEAIKQEAQRIIDKGINDAMRHTYGPRKIISENEQNSEMRNNQFGYDAKGKIATAANSSVFIQKPKVVNELKINQMQNSSLMQSQIKRNISEVKNKHVVEKSEEQKKVDHQTKQYISSMAHRVLNNNKTQACPSPYLSLQKTPGKLPTMKHQDSGRLSQEFHQITRNTKLQMLTQADLDNFHGDHRSWKRQEAFNESLNKPGASQLSKSVGGIHRMTSKKSTQDKKTDDSIISDRLNKNTAEFNLSAENQERVENCKNILTNQRLYAETILINARTGKRVKEQYQKKPGLGGKGKTSFQQYQDNLFSQTSNYQIAQVLNQSKRYELSQLKEDFGIMKYIKKKFQNETFNKDIITDAKLQEIKQKYFQDLMNKSELNNSIFTKIQDIDFHAKNIYQELLSKSKGLDGRLKEENTFYDENEITPQMQGEQAIAEALRQARSDANKEKQKGKQMDQQSDGCERLTSNINTSKDEHKLSHVTSLKTDEFDKDSFGSPSKLRKSYKPSGIQTGEETKQNTGRQQNEPEMRNSSQRTNQTGAPSTVGGRKPKSVQQVYLDSDYWYHKGVVLNQKQENQFALHCYEQALKLNEDHQASIFNLACAYEKLSRYEDALNAFQRAIKVKEDWPDAHYGLALCCLKLNRHKDAVGHIQSALHWCKKEYEIKVEKRRLRHIQRERARLESLEKTGASATRKSGNTLRKQIDQDGDVNQGAADEGAVVYSEDEDENDDLYIDPATIQNDGVSTHIMYVHALCYRENKEYATALSSYAKVMKRESQIGDYEKMIQSENFKNLSLKIVNGPGYPGWKIDLYSHFQRMKLLKENNRMHMVDLTQYFDFKGMNGWSHDKIPNVIKDLQLVRFFNRFDRETLYQMIKKTSLRQIKKSNLLFLEQGQSAIVINGNLYLFTHKHDVATPSLQAIFTPGDIIGNSNIDGGWSRDTHSWIIAYQTCDILIINTEYVDYIWDKMKGFKNINFIAERLKSSPCFKNLTEQSIYTIAFDMIFLKKFSGGEKICPQSTTSVYNIQFQKKEKDSIEKFTDRMTNDAAFQKSLAQFRSQKDPVIDWEFLEERAKRTEYRKEVLNEIVRREATYGRKKKPDEEEQAAKEQKEKEQKEDEDELEHKPKDIYELQFPDFGVKLSPDQEQDERKRWKERAPKYAEMVREYVQMDEIFHKGIIGMTDKLIDQLENHKKAKLLYPRNSGGIYILLEGSAVVKNSYDPDLDKIDSNDDKITGHGFEFKRPLAGPLDVLGAERYLQVQGYSYYGNVYAAKEEVSVTCGFIKEEMLYLLPYYDLYQLKNDLEAKYYPSAEERDRKEKEGIKDDQSLVKMKDKAEKHFKRVLREINAEIDNFAKKVKKNQSQS